MCCAVPHAAPPALQGHEKLDSPLDALDALEACAAKGAARALCALAASSFRAATLLGMTCEEAASLGPRQSLQVLLMKGPQAAPVQCLHKHRGIAVHVVHIPHKFAAKSLEPCRWDLTRQPL